MNEQIKNTLGGVMIIVAVMVTFAVASYVVTYSKSIDPSSFRSFSVSGDGKSVGVPDVAQVTFSVITEGGKDIGKLQQENTGKVNAINTFTKEQGIGDKDIRTQNYNIDPRYQYFSCPQDGGACPPAQIVGYTINQSVQVKIRDFTKIGPLLSGMVQKGANAVSQLTFAIDDPTSVQNDARAEAIVKARQKAEGLAVAGGFRIGKLLSIEEYSSAPPTPYPMYERAMGGGGGAPSIEPGSQEVSVSVTLRYEIK
ncbi:MAG: SIMPL domain-containing protein [Candidatus Azambacteria bacterium]|nr:SIMPL domain-containing protein [Candidatus Azambacteria bacterium]